MSVHPIGEAKIKADKERADVLADYALLLRLPDIARFVQRGRDPTLALYTIEFADGREVRVGNVEVIFSQARLTRALSVTLGHHPPALARDEWADLTQALVNGGLTIEEMEGQEFKDSVREWLGAYTSRATRDREGSARRREPFIDEDEHLHIALEPLATYIRRHYSEQVKLTDLQTALSDLGFVRLAVKYAVRESGSKRTTASYYRAPIDVLDAGDVLE